MLLHARTAAALVLFMHSVPASLGAVLLNQGASHNFKFANLPTTGFDASLVGHHRAVLEVSFTGNLLNSGETVRVLQYEDFLSDPRYSGGDNAGSPRSDIPGLLMSSSTDLSNPNNVGFWADRQGVVRIAMPTGSLTLDYIRVTVTHDGVVYSQQSSFNRLSLLGDFDIDDDVDGADFLNWQRGASPEPRSAADIAAWRAKFGTVGSSGVAETAGVPEPASWLLLVLGAVAFRRWRW